MGGGILYAFEIYVAVLLTAWMIHKFVGSFVLRNDRFLGSMLSCTNPRSSHADCFPVIDSLEYSEIATEPAKYQLMTSAMNTRTSDHYFYFGDYLSFFLFFFCCPAIRNKENNLLLLITNSFGNVSTAAESSTIGTCDADVEPFRV